MEDLEAWYTTCEQTSVKIWVENPEVLVEKTFLGAAKKSYTTFRVLMKSSSGEVVGVRHRYSEFETLRENLRDRYLPLGIFVPNLPHKKIIGNTESDFIKERMMGLSLFCEGIVQCPFLRYDKAFRDFMDMKENDKNQGEMMLAMAFGRLSSPTNPLVRYMVLKEEVAAMEKFAKQVLESARQQQLANAAVASANTAMQSALSGWGYFESESVRALNGKYNGQQDPVMREGDSVPKTLNRLSAFYSQSHSATADLPDYGGALIGPVLEYELNRCLAFLELFKYHDDVANFIEKQRAKVEKMDPSKADKYNEAVSILEEKRICIGAFYKGLLYFSAPIACRDRAVNLRRAAGYMGSTMLVSAAALEKSCVSLLKDLEINAASSVTATSVVLEQVSLKPLDASHEILMGSTWRELPPMLPQCHGLLKLAMGIVVSPAAVAYESSSYNASTGEEDRDISALLKQAEIVEAASRSDPFEEIETESRAPAMSYPHQTAPPVPQPYPVDPPRVPDREKVNSLLGDLTGAPPTQNSSDDLWS